MITKAPDADTLAVGWELELIDPKRNHRKFYRLVVAGSTVVTNYGRIGQSGSFRVAQFDSVTEARDKVVDTTRAKELKGYTGSIEPVRFTVPDQLITHCVRGDSLARAELINQFLNAC
ncbi:WGR domain-containing protein (plasmid) [Streptosporangium sp. CA-135522]|uniref:WGR domain-containing protein n=1 Tax=Streptosporangium sp. CA-135522 TaxID=3240072 RepID=UPI003D8E7608